MRPDTIAKEITTPWSDKDKLEMGDSLATMLEQLDNLKTEAKASAKGYSDQKEKLEADIAATGRKYKKGYAIETVSCDIRYNDPEPGKKSLYRMDTAAHIETLDMTWEEKQDELQFNIPKDGSESTPTGVPDTSLCECHNVLRANCPDNFPGGKNFGKGKGKKPN